MEEIVNRVAKSPVLTLDLNDYKLQEEVVGIDLASVLFMGQILRESDFNSFVESYDWDSLANKIAALYCSVEAIVPQWTFLSLAARAMQKAKMVFFATPQEALIRSMEENLNKIDFEPFRGKVVVLKGCGQDQIPLAVQVKAASKLSLYARKILYGEPCSAVPIFKK